MNDEMESRFLLCVCVSRFVCEVYFLFQCIFDSKITRHAVSRDNSSPLKTTTWTLKGWHWRQQTWGTLESKSSKESTLSLFFSCLQTQERSLLHHNDSLTFLYYRFWSLHFQRQERFCIQLFFFIQISKVKHLYNISTLELLYNLRLERQTVREPWEEVSDFSAKWSVSVVTTFLFFSRKKIRQWIRRPSNVSNWFFIIHEIPSDGKCISSTHEEVRQIFILVILLVSRDRERDFILILYLRN